MGMVEAQSRLSAMCCEGLRLGLAAEPLEDSQGKSLAGTLTTMLASDASSPHEDTIEWKDASEDFMKELLFEAQPWSGFVFKYVEDATTDCVLSTL